ncbi:hypothetical protein ACOSP7_020213 [Xanthoceras sorbifolium]
MYKETEFTSQNQRQNLTTLQYRFGAILLSWEEALWREGPWSIELLADTLHPYLPVWIEQEKYTCLYGGEAIDWIRRFTLTAKGVAQAETILLEMFYTGNSNPKRKVARKIATFYC